MSDGRRLWCQDCRKWIHAEADTCGGCYLPTDHGAREVTDSVSQDIASFLLARISEGEREMRDAVDFNEADRAEVGDVFYAEWGYRDPGTWRGIAGRSADLASKRRIVERYIYLADNGDSGDARWVLPLLALPYGEHPDFDPAWTVED